MRTHYEDTQGEFSHRAHIAARKQIYPRLFGAEEIEYEDVRLGTGYRGKVLDGELGVDVIARPGNGLLSGPLSFYIQERFRRPEFSRYGDITITEFNHASGQLSELYKMAAGLMVYGIYDDKIRRFTKGFAVDVTRLFLSLQRGTLRFSRERNKKQQSFVCLKLEALHEAGCLLWKLKTEPQTFDIPDEVRPEEFADYLNEHDEWLPEELRGSA